MQRGCICLGSQFLFFFIWHTMCVQGKRYEVRFTGQGMVILLLTSYLVSHTSLWWQYLHTKREKSPFKKKC
jgi:hypothetical protein